MNPVPDDQRLAERVARAEEGARVETEHTIQRTRLVALVLLVAQSALYLGGTFGMAALSIALLVTVATIVELLLRAEDRGRRIAAPGAVGVFAMVGDTAVVAVVLLNLRSNPTDPIQFLPLVLVVEAAARWSRAGGWAGGLGGGMLTAAWAVDVHHRQHVDLPLAFVTFRVALLTMVGVMVGTTVRNARRQQRVATTIVNASRDVVASFALDGTLLAVNPAIESILGYDAEELLRGPRALRLDLPTAGADGQLVGSARLMEVRALHRDGRPVWIELDLLPDRVAGVIHAIGRDVSSRRRTESELRHRVDHDALTGLSNRDAMTSYVARMLDHGFLPALVFVDLDDFKGINDSYGHVAGDLLLSEVAARLCAAAGLEGSVARYAGDEFCLVVDDPLEVETVADRARRRLQDPFVLGGEVLAVSATLGVAVGRPGDTAATLVDRADQAMYAGKAARRRR